MSTSMRSPVNCTRRTSTTTPAMCICKRACRRSSTVGKIAPGCSASVHSLAHQKAPLSLTDITGMGPSPMSSASVARGFKSAPHMTALIFLLQAAAIGVACCSSGRPTMVTGTASQCKAVDTSHGTCGGGAGALTVPVGPVDHDPREPCQHQSALIFDGGSLRKLSRVCS